MESINDKISIDCDYCHRGKCVAPNAVLSTGKSPKCNMNADYCIFFDDMEIFSTDKTNED